MSMTTQPRAPDEREILRNQLTKMAGEFRMALPSHIKPDHFQRVVMTAVQQDPDILLADRRTLLMAATKAAQDGLLPDKREAAFVIFNSKVKREGRDVWVKSVVYMPMIAGIQKRALNTGLVTSLQGHVIYANDHFLWQQGTEEKLEHRPLFPGDRGEPIGAYAVARIKGEDRPLFRVMDKERINKARSVSKNADGAVWKMWWDEMAIKTVVRNLAKSLPSDAEMAMERAFNRDDERADSEEPSVTIDAVLTDDQRAAPLSRLDVIEGGIVDDEDGEG